MTLATPLVLPLPGRLSEHRPPLKRIRGCAIAPQPNSATVPALALGAFGAAGTVQAACTANDPI
ncbi:MAG: hypothetical protein QOJ42_5206 [Acidobacteriaceae bacterium]|jgi:hypothetical protein|nr:hypothetical protein [Acidobacteriaceae bacterium]